MTIMSALVFILCFLSATPTDAQNSVDDSGDRTPMIVAPEDPISSGGSYQAVIGEDWNYPLVKKGKLNNPLVEVTPFVFRDRFFLLENWQKHWETKGSEDGAGFQKDEVRIRLLNQDNPGDLDGGQIVSTPFIGHGLGMAMVWQDQVYVFAGNWGTEKKWQIREISMVHSGDLRSWSDPVTVLRAQPDEHFFNVSVCRANDRFVMLVESDDKTWPAFTFKYFESTDLVHWKQVPDALYGCEKYVGGPALYYYGDMFYTLYLESLGNGRYETRLTRSKDLIHWQDAPAECPFVTFNPENPVHPLRPSEIREKNASDAELCEFQGTTYIFYTGGDQHVAGDLQLATYKGEPKELLEYFYQEPRLYVPNAPQQNYQENQLGAFVHFGLASFTGGDFLAAPDASVFNPKELDTEQWVRAAKSFGAKHIVLTAKHHSGFCLWPTKTTDYSVKNTPWRDGQGDVVRDLAEAARKNGIELGLYFSACDKHFPCSSTGDPLGKRVLIGDRHAYFPVFMEQLRELLTNYGELAVVWFDGAYDPLGYDVKGANGKPAGTSYGDAICSMVRDLQPSAAVFGGSRPDIRWSGSEQGWAPYPIWNVIRRGEGIPLWAPPYVQGWIGAEANVHTRSNWFWMPNTDDTLKTTEQLVDIYYESIGRGANLLVNMTPDSRGLIPEKEVDRLRSFGEEIERRFHTPLARTDSDGRWLEGNVLELDLGGERQADNVVVEEDIRYGQRIRAYCIQAWNEGKWETVADGQSIGRKRVQRFEPVMIPKLRLRVTDTLPLPGIREFAAYSTK
ncbi:MAG TPA: alpha-L-fucosidase [bacterium]|nr:alpha-L-fucosidase [bacterium]HQO33727.1 alpha-L-fucosidase [bacterium]HQP99405.1 alpha-L-fucosidase [bacterium]